MKENKLPFILSIAIHLAIIIALISISPVNSYRLDTSAPNTQPVVHAAVIDAAKLSAQVQAIQTKEAEQQAKQQQQVQQMQAQAEAVRKAKLADEQRLAQIKANQQQAMQQLQAEQQRLVQLKAQQKQQQEAAEKALALKKQQQESAAKALALKKQQQAEQAKTLALKKQQQAIQAQAAAKKMQAELDAKQKALQQQLMQQQLANDQAQLAKAQQMQGVIDQYRARILMAIADQWLIPDSVDPSIFCVFTIDLTPAGVVSHAQLVRSSGNVALDRAAETAIYKASPLPVPSDPQIFAPFRHFTLKMTPQDVRR